MNSPPEPDAPPLLQAMADSLHEVMCPHGKPALYDLLRYQDFGGSHEDREAGVQWLRSHLPQCTAAQVMVAPGIHGVLLALMSLLARPGEIVCVESLCYPGIKAIAAQLGVKLQALPMDGDGLLPEAFEHACKTLYPRALICNPTIHNPTTATLPRERREAIADIALRYSIPLIEDDAYGKLTDRNLPTLSSLAPELTYYISGLSKSLGAGLRLAYVHAPSEMLGQRLAGALRATAVMASPITAALATRWIVSGLAYRMLDAIRAESAARQALASRYLQDFEVQTHPDGFHLWLQVPQARSATELAASLRAQGVPAVASVAFSTDADPPPALRLCLGGHVSRNDVQQSLRVLAIAMDQMGQGYSSAL